MEQNKAEILSKTQKIYLLTVHELTLSHGHAHIIAIAKTLNVSMPSVIEAMRKLESKNLVHYGKRKYITLQPAAMSIVFGCEERTQVIENFARKVLSYSSHDSKLLARKLFHHVDDTFCSRLSKHINTITCPKK